MKWLRHILFVVLLLNLFQYSSFSQQYADKNQYLVDSLDLFQLNKTDRLLIDSCLEIYHTAKNDAVKLNAINKIVDASWDENVWPKYNRWVFLETTRLLKSNQSDEIEQQLKVYLAGALGNIGLELKNKGNLTGSLDFQLRSLSLLEELERLTSMAVMLNNIGMTYSNQGDIPTAMEYLHRSLRIQEVNNDSIGIAHASHNVAVLYEEQGDTIKAFEFYNKSLEIHTSLGDKRSAANALINLGHLHLGRRDTDKALANFRESLIIYKEVSFKQGISIAYNCLGIVSFEKNDLANALKYYSKSLELDMELGNKKGISISLSHVALVELKQGNLEAAKTSANRSLMLAKEMGSPALFLDPALTLKKIALLENNYSEALEIFELYIAMKDSINNDNTQKATIRQQTKYEFEKAELVKEQELKEEGRKLKEQTDRRNNLQYSLIFLGILLFFGGVLSLGFVKIPPAIVEGLIFFAFLILFEFLLVLLDPFIDGITNGEPIYKLVANAAIAGLIFPVHAFFERMIKQRISKK